MVLPSMCGQTHGYLGFKVSYQNQSPLRLLIAPSLCLCSSIMTSTAGSPLSLLSISTLLLSKLYYPSPSLFHTNRTSCVGFLIQRVSSLLKRPIVHSHTLPPTLHPMMLTGKNYGSLKPLKESSCSFGASVVMFSLLGTISRAV